MTNWSDYSGVPLIEYESYSALSSSFRVVTIQHHRSVAGVSATVSPISPTLYGRCILADKRIVTTHNSVSSSPISFNRLLAGSAVCSRLFQSLRRHSAHCLGVSLLRGIHIAPHRSQVHRIHSIASIISIIM